MTWVQIQKGFFVNLEQCRTVTLGAPGNANAFVDTYQIAPELIDSFMAEFYLNLSERQRKVAIETDDLAGAK